MDVMLETNANAGELFGEHRNKMEEKMKERKGEMVAAMRGAKEESDAHYDGCIYDAAMLSDSSKRSYVGRMRFIQMNYGNGTASVHCVLTHPWRYAMRIIDSPVSIKSKDNSFVCVLAYLTYTGLKGTHHILFTMWYAAYMVVYKELKRVREGNIPTEKQARSMLNWEDIVKRRDELSYGSMEHILLSMHTYIPPRRQQDYYAMRVYTDERAEPEKDHNYFQLYNKRLGSPVLFYKEYKNAKYLSSFLNKEVPRELVDIVRHSVAHYPREYLIVNPKTGTHYGYQEFINTMNAKLKKITGNAWVSVNTLRHAFVNYISNKPLTLGQRKRLAIKMGHGLPKNMEYMLFGGKRASADETRREEL